MLLFVCDTSFHICGHQIGYLTKNLIIFKYPKHLSIFYSSDFALVL